MSSVIVIGGDGVAHCGDQPCKDIHFHHCHHHIPTVAIHASFGGGLDVTPVLANRLVCVINVVS
jgi:hypothetical protein